MTTFLLFVVALLLFFLRLMEHSGNLVEATALLTA